MSSAAQEKAKTIKNALKEAKEHIDKKDYKSALRYCKKAINIEKDNYMSLVFCGLCLCELDQLDQAIQVNSQLRTTLITRHSTHLATSTYLILRLTFFRLIKEPLLVIQAS